MEKSSAAVCSSFLIACISAIFFNNLAIPANYPLAFHLHKFPPGKIFVNNIDYYSFLNIASFTLIHNVRITKIAKFTPHRKNIYLHKKNMFTV